MDQKGQPSLLRIQAIMLQNKEVLIAEIRALRIDDVNTKTWSPYNLSIFNMFVVGGTRKLSIRLHVIVGINSNRNGKKLWRPCTWSEWYKKFIRADASTYIIKHSTLEYFAIIYAYHYVHYKWKDVQSNITERKK